MPSGSRTLSRWALWLLAASCTATSPGTSPPAVSAPAPVPALEPDAALLVHRNAPGEPPQLCLVSPQLSTWNCDERVGLFAGSSGAHNAGHPVIIVEKHPDGTRERLGRWTAPNAPLSPLTPWTGRVRDPVWSPDGRTAYLSSDAQGTSDLAAVGADGTGEPAWLAPHPAGSFEPDPHPAGDRLAFASSRDGNAELYLLALTPGAIPTRLTHDEADDMRPRWSADGAILAFLSNRGTAQQVWTMEPGGEPKPLLPTVGDAQVDLAWAPTGTRLAIVAGPSPDRTRVLIADGMSGVVLTELGEPGLAVQQPAWSPDGQHLAFTCQKPGQLPAVCIAPASGGAVQIVASDPQNEVWLPRWYRGP